MAGGTIADGMVVDAAMQSGIMVGGMVDGTIVWHCKSLWRQDVGGEKGSGLSEELRESLLWAMSHGTITGIPGFPPLKNPQHSCPEAGVFRVLNLAGQTPTLSKPRPQQRTNFLESFEREWGSS